MTEKEYRVVEGDENGEFSESVSRFREEGWEPTGGVCVTVVPMPEEDEDHYEYYQAMVRDIEIKDKKEAE